jgi:hypothetical protein
MYPAPRRSAPPASPPIAEPSGGHGLRTAIIWIVVLLALAALVAALVMHLSQIHSGASAFTSGAMLSVAGHFVAHGPLAGLRARPRL